MGPFYISEFLEDSWIFGKASKTLHTFMQGTNFLMMPNVS